MVQVKYIVCVCTDELYVCVHVCVFLVHSGFVASRFQAMNL